MCLQGLQEISEIDLPTHPGKHVSGVGSPQSLNLESKLTYSVLFPRSMCITYYFNQD